MAVVRDFCRAESAWFGARGIDPADWDAVHPVLTASKRAHARRVGELSALDRMWVLQDPESARPWWPSGAA
ncbi:MAG: hypothetical protein WKF82_10870 [Nocardioidaceae bacterium]